MLPSVSRILLVEDDPDQAQLFALILKMDGYEVLKTTDAESALARLTEDRVALLLADWDLPGMKGDRLITTVKAQDPTIKAILFSNHAHVAESAATCSADEWFRKMDDPARLRRMIAHLLREAVGQR
jgi:DNA-binding NtrC family response regulator